MNTSQNNHEVWIDVLRAVACVCVLICHSPVSYDGAEKCVWILGPLTYVMMACGVSIFFMISGALLLYKPQPLLEFYKRRFSKVAIPIIFWSIIYILIDYFRGKLSTGIFKSLLLTPFTSQIGLMWFMYVLCGIYLVTPILSVWLSTVGKREVQILLLLWGATLILPYIRPFVPEINDIGSEVGLLYYLSGFLGFSLLGYYIRKYVTIKNDSLIFISILLISIIGPVILFISGHKELLSSTLSLFSVGLSSIVFIFFKNIQYSDTIILRTARVFAKYSFGVYLTHMLFMCLIKGLLCGHQINYLVQIPSTAFVCGALALALTIILSKFKVGRKIIGC